MIANENELIFIKYLPRAEKVSIYLLWCVSCSPLTALYLEELENYYMKKKIITTQNAKAIFAEKST